MTARSPQRQRLQDLLHPVVSAAGYELVDVTVSAAGRRSLVRVTVDADAGIDLDGVAVVSREVSAALDANDDAFAGPFVLEVSSPGVDRPLTEPRLWQRALGRLVRVELADVPEPVLGRVIQLDDAGLTLEVAGAATTYPWAQVGTGRVQVEFNRPGSAAEGSDADLAGASEGEYEDEED
ncbi:MAG TPA: ribosome maturation factor RimP [Jatrophihabitans sp.]|nr:ribosome maturation factor RimP [Jatrophihabitans sp.]